MPDSQWLSEVYLSYFITFVLKIFGGCQGSFSQMNGIRNTLSRNLPFQLFKKINNSADVPNLSFICAF